VSQSLRPYQARAIAETREAYRAGKRSILLVAPTGAGKTKIGAEFAMGAISKGGTALWLAHREELISQARDRLLAEGVERVGVIAAGYPLINAPVQVASIQTLAARIRRGLPTATVVILDEAHHGKASTYAQVLEGLHTFDGGKPLRIGLTATPERGDGAPLGDLFDHVVTVSSIRELQSLGVLVPCLTYAPSSATKELSQDPVAAYLARTPGDRAFCFGLNVAHVEGLAKAFVAAGVPAATVHANTPWLLRRARVEAFRTQDAKPLLEAGALEPAPLVLCNVFTLTEGVDVPEASSCILARGCGHPGLFLQMVGRVLRAAPGKTHATLIDLRGVVHKLGLPEQDREWKLEGKAIELAAKEREVKLKVCSSCSGAFASWNVDAEGWRTCPFCGAKGPPAPTEIKARELHVMGSLAPPEVRDRWLQKFSADAVRLGYKPGWAAVRFKERFGSWPSKRSGSEAYARAVSDVGADAAAEALAKRALMRQQRADAAAADAAPQEHPTGAFAEWASA
jgi:superfamily II DNA or RNA helicase